jgi:hypothetical protein
MSQPKSFAMNRSVDTIIFDPGGVLIDWNLRYVYRKIFFLRKVSLGLCV